MSSHCGGDDEGQPQLPSPIQRILLIHLNLYERSMQNNGESLSEGASLEELSEQILYYHRDPQLDQQRSSGADHHRSAKKTERLMEEAVQFLGLCTALYSLPSSIGASIQSSSSSESVLKHSRGSAHHADHTTKEIYFEKSTLVFIPLESSEDIVAVVQVARSSKGEGVSNTGSGNPLAIRKSIERSHSLFSLLNGGGILHRLNGDPRPYEGMDQLFRLLRDLRKAKERVHRIDNKGEEYAQLTDRIQAILGDVRDLRRRLIIQSVRRDLNSHYKEYLSEFSLIASRNGGAGRCLVETFPIPIAQDSGSHASQLPASFASPRTIQTLKEALQLSLNNSSQKDSNLPGIVAIAIFHKGQPVHTVTSPKDSIIIPRETTTTNLLMAYMSSYKSKMTHATQYREYIPSITGSTSTNPNAQSGIRSLTRSIGSMAGSLTKDEMTAEQPKSPQDEDSQRRGRFLATPPSFMLSASHQIHSVEWEDDKGSIWAPRIHLRTTSQSSATIKLHMVMFCVLDFSFLVFLSIQSSTKESLDSLRPLLLKLEDELSDAVRSAEYNDSSNVSTKNNDTVMEWINSPGQDIILLERNKDQMILLPDPTTASSRHSTRFRKLEKKPQQRRFLGFGPRMKEDRSKNLPTNLSATIEWSALGLDCRHRLASRLPLDVCLAFDDMINEMAMRRTTSDQGNSLEMCTCMSHGWIYAYLKGDKEIYVFFDNSIYVTVADVQSAALRIRETFAAA